MVDKPSDVKPDAGTVTPATPGSVKPVTPEPAKTVQPSPTAPKPGVTPAQGDKPEQQQVPIASLLEERNKRQALEAELNLLRQQQQQQPPQQQVPQASPMAQEIEKLWETDPRRAVQAEMMMAIDWYDRVNNNLETQADVLSTRYPDFNNWRSAALRYVRSLPTQQRSQPGVLDMAYFVVRGQNVDSILSQQNEDLMRKFQTGELAAQTSIPAGTVSQSYRQSGVQLTDEQRAAASAMGISEEDYVKYTKVKPPMGGY